MPPDTEDGTRIGVVMPASRHASTPSRTSAALPNSVTSASHRSPAIFAISSPLPSASAFSTAAISAS